LTALARAQDSAAVDLVAGESVRATVQGHGYTYFRIRAQGPHKDLTIATTPLSGDPDLYVSTKTEHPTTHEYEWSRAHLGGDTITIAAEDEHACPDCVYNIGVYGYADSEFTIVASFGGADPVRLVLGQPQADHVSGGSFRQYAMNVTPSVLEDGGVASDLRVRHICLAEIALTFNPCHASALASACLILSSYHALPIMCRRSR
jgi:hypothetical protein